MLKNERVSVTSAEGDGASRSSRCSPVSSALVLMGVGLKSELLRRFFWCLLDLRLGSLKSSSHAAKSAEFFFVSCVSSSSTGVSSFGPIGYRTLATSGGNSVKHLGGPSISYSTACGNPNCTFLLVLLRRGCL